MNFLGLKTDSTTKFTKEIYNTESLKCTTEFCTPKIQDSFKYTTEVLLHKKFTTVFLNDNN